jgi:hypothetical protein
MGSGLTSAVVEVSISLRISLAMQMCRTPAWVWRAFSLGAAIALEET